MTRKTIFETVHFKVKLICSVLIIYSQCIQIKIIWMVECECHRVALYQPFYYRINKMYFLTLISWTLIIGYHREPCCPCNNFANVCFESYGQNVTKWRSSNEIPNLQNIKSIVNMLIYKREIENKKMYSYFCYLIYNIFFYIL